MRDVLPLSVIIMTRNEAINLPHCLASCLTSSRSAAEVFVVDSDSTDETCAIARSYGARLVSFVWDGRYPKKKQWCLDHLPISQPWTLFLDADEQLTPALLDQFCDVLNRAEGPSGYYLQARVGHRGQVMQYGRRHRKLSLFRTGSARFPVVDDLDSAGGWEVEGHYQPIVDGAIGYLSAPLLHHDLKPDADWRARHLNYADWAAMMRLRGALTDSRRHEHWSRRWAKSLLDHTPLRPLAAFIDSYVLCLGFLDGRIGLSYACARAWYYREIDRAVRRHKQVASRSSDAAAGTTATVPSNADGDCHAATAAPEGSSMDQPQSHAA